MSTLSPFDLNIFLNDTIKTLQTTIAFNQQQIMDLEKKLSEKDKEAKDLKSCLVTIQISFASFASIIVELKKLRTLVYIRYLVENVDDYIKYHFVLLNFFRMLEIVRTREGWRDHTNPSQRTVTYFYYLTSGDTEATKIKNLIIEKGFELLEFCLTASKVYSLCSTDIHVPLRKLATEELSDGMKLLQFVENDIVECIGVLKQIRDSQSLKVDNMKEKDDLAACSSSTAEPMLLNQAASATGMGTTTSRPTHGRSLHGSSLGRSERGGFRASTHPGAGKAPFRRVGLLDEHLPAQRPPQREEITSPHLQPQEPGLPAAAAVHQGLVQGEEEERGDGSDGRRPQLGRRPPAGRPAGHLPAPPAAPARPKKR